MAKNLPVFIVLCLLCTATLDRESAANELAKGEKNVEVEHKKTNRTKSTPGQTPIPPGQNHFLPYPDDYYNRVNNMTRPHRHRHHHRNHQLWWLIINPFYLFERRLANFWRQFL